MKKKNLYKITALLLVLVSVAFTGCKEDEFWEYPHMFRPINFNADLNKTQVTLSWSEVEGAESYTLQVTLDSLNYSSLVLDTTITDHTFKQDFEGKQNFRARVRANAADTTKNSKFNELVFSTPSENILIPNQILVNALKTVQVAWEAGRTVTHIEMTDENAHVESFQVTAEEAALGLKTVVVANNNQKYSVSIFNGHVLRGKSSLKVEGDAFLNAGESLKDAVAAATGSYYVIVLKPGSFDLTGSGVCPAGTNLILKGSDPVNRSKVNVQNNTVVLTLPATADSVVVRNVDFEAVTPSNTAYFINQSAAATVGTLKFDGCNFTGFGNNILRLQGTATKNITNFIVNNAIVTNCGNGASAMPSNGTYAFVNSNVDAGKILHINISNSTFNGVSHSFLNVPGAATASTNIVNAITVENCTFYNFIGGTTSVRYFIDGGASTNVSIDVTLRNLIMGKTMATNLPLGIRKNAGNLIVESVYTTSDFSSNISIPGVTTYSKSSNDLWTSPSTGDFTIKDATFAGKGKAGDLRWK